MTIYMISNCTKPGNDYVSTELADITANSTNTFINSIALGDINTANSILAVNQVAYLTNQKFRLNVNTTIVNGNATTVSGVNYATEPDNETKVYNVFNDLIGTYTTVTGTTAMMSTIADYQSQLLTAANLNSVIEVTTIPQPRKVQPSTTGTQTL